jgi:putative ABC transport system permease protein
MIKNYITFAIRHLLRDTTVGLINIVGLALSLCACILIVRYCSFELSYDRFHIDPENIYRLQLDVYKDGNIAARSARVSPAVASVFQNKFPEIKNYTRLVILGPDGVLTYNDRYSGESDILLADSSFFDVFSFRLIRGSEQTAFNEPFCVVITESTAARIFGDEDPLGKSVVINAKNFDNTSIPFKVTGVIKNFPENSHLLPGVLISYSTLFEFVGHQFDNSWTWNETYTYLRLHEGASESELQAKFPEVVHTLNPQLAEQHLDWKYNLQSATDIHLKSAVQHEVAINGNIIYVYLLIATGVLILAIAYINFTNLITVRFSQRAREVGVRKVSGAFRRQLVVQFCVESVVINLFSLCMGIVLSSMIAPMIAERFGVTFSDSFTYPKLLIAFSALVVLAMIGSGLYPALALSRYKPVLALKGGYISGSSRGIVRKVFITGQFSAAMILIGLTLAAIAQVSHMQKQSLGFTPEQVVVVRSPKAFDYGYGGNFSAFRERMSSHTSVASIAGSNAVPGQEIYWYDDQVTINNKETSGVFSMLAVSKNYFTHFGIPLVAGRAFVEGKQDDDKWIVNETAVKTLGYQNADQLLGQKLNGKEIVGVVKDFHHESLKTEIPPIAFTPGEVFNYYMIRTGTENIADVVETIRSTYITLFPGSPFDYFFLDSFFDSQYKNDKVFNDLFGLFSSLAILVACLGLFGLASYLTRRRFKEIGIRKVMGASVAGVVMLLVRDFIRPVLVAGIIAIPIEYFLAERWLENYAIRVDISWWLLVVPVAATLILAFTVVSMQTIRAAQINPSQSLRDE